jgi:hypothetical protein
MFKVTLTMWQTALLANAFLLYSLPHLLFGHLVSSGKLQFVPLLQFEKGRVGIEGQGSGLE